MVSNTLLAVRYGRVFYLSNFNYMQKYIQYIQEFHNSNSVEIDFINNHLKKYLETNIESQDEIEQILDYLFSNPNIDISKF